MEDLLEEKKALEESILIRKAAYKGAVVFLKVKEKELRQAKKVKYQTYRDWKAQELRLKRLENKIHSTPSRLRKWGKDNFDKVWNTMEGK